MNNAIWLLTVLPNWYLEGATHPLSAGALTLIPAIGLLALAVGLILGAIKRRRELLWFLFPFALSEGLVAIAGIFRGSVPYGASTGLSIFFLVYLAAQLVAFGYLIYHIKGARTAATALSIFSLSYALFATFVAGMSFTDSWL
jgi:hypothetical protein